jgi:branched-chain amino acid transport system permease protein
MNAPARPRAAAFALLLAAIVLAPLQLYPVFVMKVLCVALFASAFNLLLGFTGLLSLGHAAYFGMGSYVSASLAQRFGLSAELCVLGGGLVGGALGALFGGLAIRRQGIYFAMITLALAQMAYFFCVQATGFTGGEDGIQSVARPKLLFLLPLADDRAMYAFVAGVFLAGFLLILRILHSPFGRLLVAIRENETRAISLGYRTDRAKLLAFVLSAALAGAAGGTKALVFGIATLTDVNWPMSGEVVLVTLLGGVGTLFGPAVGALIVVAMETYLAPYGDWVTVAQGSVFVLCVLAFRAGVVGTLAGLVRKTFIANRAASRHSPAT